MLVPGALMVAVSVSLVCTMSPAVTALEFESWAPLRNTEPVLFTTATPVFCAKTTGASPKRTRQMHLFERDELTQDAFGLMVTSSACRVNQQSYPIQDEPEGEMGFQYKMSLERMAC